MAYGAAGDSSDAPDDDTTVEVDVAEEDLPTLETLVGWHDDWEERTRDDRDLSARDYDYYDGIQWTREEIDELNNRGQPVLTKNKIARKVNFILGDEADRGVDPVARPKTPQHEDDARAATDGLRATEETQGFDAIRSAMFKDLLVAGWGGAMVEGDPDPKAETCAPLTHVPWDRLWWDPHSLSPDFEDAKFRGVILWMHLDDAIEEYPEAEEALRSIVNQDDSVGTTTQDKPKLWADKSLKRVKICEAYFKIGPHYFRACFTMSAMLRPPEPTGYLDDWRRRHVCPLLMTSCYIRNRTNARYGVVRAMISPQDEVNKRDSKSLYQLTVTGVIVERDFIRDPQHFQTELAKPDGFAEVEQGGLSENRIQLRGGMELAAGHIQLAQQARADIDSIGPSSSTLPDIPDSASGRAFIARQKAAAKELAPVFANLYRWDHAVMQQDWMRICQFRTEEWWLRVTDDEELTGYRFVVLNHQMTRGERLQELVKKGVPPEQALQTAAGEWAPIILRQAVQGYQQQAQIMAAQAQAQGQQPPQQDPTQGMLAIALRDPLMREPVTVNQAAKMGVDILIDTAPESAVPEEEEFDSIAKLLPTVVQARPDLAATMVKALIKVAQFRAKRQILQEIDKGPDPQAAQAQQAMQSLQLEGAKAGVAVQQSQAQLNTARAQGEQVKAQVAGAKAPVEIQETQASAMLHAANVGQKTAAPPQGAPS